MLTEREAALLCHLLYAAREMRDAEDVFGIGTSRPDSYAVEDAYENLWIALGALDGERP